MALDYSKVTDRQRVSIDEVMDTFDFEKVHQYMIYANWGWAKPNSNDPMNLEVPDVFEIKSALRKMLVDTFSRMTLLKEENPNIEYPINSSCGGFAAYIYPNDTCEVYFYVTSCWTEDYIFGENI